MKNQQLLISILFFHFCTSGLFSQINNVEILDHSDERTILTSLVYDNEDIIYVTQNDRRGASTTHVKLTNGNDKPVDLLNEELNFEHDSKVLHDSDGNLRIYLYNLTNPGFDDFSPNFIEIKEEVNGYVSTEIDNPIVPDRVVDVAIDSMDRIYTLTFERLQIFESNILQVEIFLRGDRLHNNKNGEVYLIDSSSDSIFQVNDLQVNFVNTTDIEIKEVKNIQDEIWAIDRDNNVYRTDMNFQDTFNEIILPFEITSLDQVSEVDDKVYILSTLDEGFELYQYQSGSTTLLISIEEDFASSDQLHMISDSTFLSAGQFEVEDISNQAFIRGHHITEESNPERVSIELENFDLFYIQDTIIGGGAPDEVFLYGFDYTLSNQGAETVNLTSVFTSDLVVDVSFIQSLFENQLNLEILPNEMITIDTTRLIAFDQPTPGTVTASVTGGDFKFNELFEPITVGITTSTKEIFSNSNILVYPNPFSNKVIVEMDSDQFIIVHNSSGQVVFQGPSDNLKNQNFSSIEDGLYFIYMPEEKQSIQVLKINGER
ncbi:T9SS type A sorting domain-containing protein [Saprospiraceae bacterium]|nr:T9SS type A sorting domain-containing protein [Saprospiraceae bacterium]